MAVPDFFVAGAPKAGTTALHVALAQHPSLFMSAVKEPKFFLFDGPPPVQGGPGDAKTYREHVWRRSEYEALFDEAPPGTLRGESTPFYLYSLDAQLRIRAQVPQAKLIIVLRDPVERAHSNWTHMWSAGLDPIDDFLEACAAEDRRTASGWAQFWHYKKLGLYGGQLEHLYSVFPREQVFLLRYHTMVQDTPGTLNKICAFLGVQTGLLSDMPRENVTAHPDRTRRHRSMAKVLRLGTLLPHSAGAGLTDRLERRLQQGGAPRQPLTWEQRRALIPYFEADIQLLGELTGDDFSDWQLPRQESGGLVGVRPAGQRQARNGRPRDF
jgi:hypothetical protein